jgi:hypothetical protein
MKWSLCSTWKQVEDFATKKEAEAALEAWKEAQIAKGWTVTGSKTKGMLMATAPGVHYQHEMVEIAKGNAPTGLAAAVVKKYEDAVR